MGEFTNAVESYFKECKGKGKGWKTVPNKAGLATHLRVTRETLSEYQRNKGKEFSDAVRNAYLRIESVLVQQLLTKQHPTGIIFYMKNAFKEDYRDRYDHTTDGKEMPAPQIIVYSSNDRLAQVMEKRSKK